jgi:putative aldouronate transport system permease protein
MSDIKSKKEKQVKFNHTLALMKRNYMLYIFLLPALLYLALFNYAPMYGIQIAFKNFVASQGILGSKWVGFKWFQTFFNSPRFWQILVNTLSVSLYMLVAGFPIPIILALVINCIPGQGFKRVAQTVTYMPHFISIVVLVGMMSVFFSPRSGFINTIIGSLGGPSDTYFFGTPEYFRHLYVWSGVWQSSGWGSIIYIAALSGVSPELHESATLDGATRIQRIWYIDIPSIVPTMVILLILNCGSLMNVGFEKAFLMQNSLNLDVAEVISTYTYKIGLQHFEYSYSAAIGLFNNIINFIILVLVNRFAKKISGSSLW